MPRIVHEEPYDGVLERINRLGLGPLIEEVRSIVRDFSLLVDERKDSNGAAVLRKMLDDRFAKSQGWVKKTTGSADWTRKKVVNGTELCVKVEIQVSARSDLLIRDVIHLRDSLELGELDIGVIVVPSDRLGEFLTNRVARFRDARRTVAVQLEMEKAFSQ